MQNNKRIFIAAAAAFALTAAGCGSGSSADWGDTLPLAVTDPPSPSVVYMTEETEEETTQVTIITPETTKRTAYSETEPELATSTGTKKTGSGGDGETDIRVVPGVPKVPISEFTSSTPLDLASDADMHRTSDISSYSAPLGSTDSSQQSSAEGSETEVKPDADKTAAPSSENSRPYAYKHLSDKELYIYDAIVTAAEQHRSSIDFSSLADITSEDYCDVYQLVYNDDNAMFYIDKKMQYTVNSATKKLNSATMFYKYSDNETKRMQAAVDEEVNRILSGITSDMTEYDKVRYIHDSIASSVTYDKDAPNCRDIYGAFVDKKAICSGITKAFSYLCGKAGIETAEVTGDADGQPHMWNKVRINGKWYNIDVTYAIGEASAGKYIRYDYFCVTDDMLADSREIYAKEYDYPEAVSSDCGYYVKNGLVAESWNGLREILRNEIIECSKTRKMDIQVQCGSASLFKDAVYNLFDDSRKEAVNILKDTLPDAEHKYDYSSAVCSNDSKSLVIKIFLKYTD